MGTPVNPGSGPLGLGIAAPGTYVCRGGELGDIVAFSAGPLVMAAANGSLGP